MRPLILLFLLVASMLGLAVASGRLEPHYVDDSSSYVNYPFDSLDAALRSVRTPGYPLLVKSVSKVAGIGAMPWFQLVLHAIASWWLCVELRRWGTPTAPAIGAMLAVAFGCTFMDNVSIIATDGPAASLGLMSGIAMLRWVRVGQTITAAAWIALFTVLAITLRPAYLALAPWTLICGLMLQRCAFAPVSHRPAVYVIVAPALITIAVVAWMSLRAAVVGDFAVLPFGHQNLAGITVQIVSDDELLATSGESAKLAAEIIRERDRIIAEGFRFNEGDPSATMTIEGRWNDIIYQVVVPAVRKIHGDDTIVNHRAIAALNRDIISRYPMRYVRWLSLAARRAAWGIAADIVMHPLFLIAIAVSLCLEWVRTMRGSFTASRGDDRGLSALFVVAFTYVVIQTGFVILTSPPLGRFADATAIMVPAWIAARAVGYFQSQQSRETTAVA